MIRVADEAASYAARVWSVYDDVFGDQPDEQAWRGTTWEPHVSRAGFRLVVAEADDGSLDGFAYGYTGEHGQWWTDRVVTTLPASVAQTWLGGHFEVVELAVLSRARRQGLGRGLVRALCAGLPHERWLLSTSDDADGPACRLYAAEGWSLLGPGPSTGTLVMGRRPAAG